MSGLPVPVLAAIFPAAAAAVWVAGIKLSDTTDVLANRLGLGEALGGLVLLAIATNLPGIAITASAALAHNVGLAIGNILGGVAIQTVVLGVLDVVGVRGRYPLTYRAASLTLVLEAALVIAILAVAVAGTRLPDSLIAYRVAPAGLLIAALWVAGLLLLLRAGNACLPVLFLLAQPALRHRGPAVGAGHDVYLTALGALLTAVYLVGLIFRSTRRIARMGVDSLVVLFLYLLGLAGLVAIATG